MRTTLIIDDVLATAKEMTGIEQKTALVQAGLKSLIEREAARRLALLGGSEPNLKQIQRRRPKVAK